MAYNSEGGLIADDRAVGQPSSSARIAELEAKNKELTDTRSEQDKLNDKIKSIYGQSSGRIGEYTDQYMQGVLGNLDKNVASADYYNQQAGRERGISNLKAGLSGVDTSAATEQSRRNAIYGAAGINEAAKREANQTLGKAAGNIASGINKIEQNREANRLASMGTPVPQDQGGLLSNLFGWL